MIRLSRANGMGFRWVSAQMENRLLERIDGKALRRKEQGDALYPFPGDDLLFA